jgi:SPP1 gp7 family putative phage head morphogenesis protein
MTKTDLYYACKLPPKEAVKFFESKGFKLSWRWEDTWQEAHSQAFTVAKVMRMDILQDIRDGVQKAISDGTTFDTFRKDLEPTLRAKGWWGKVWVGDETGKAQQVQLGSPWRLQTIYDTNVQSAYMAGRYRDQVQNVDDRPYGEYVSVIDARTSRLCRDLNGKTFPLSDPFWNNFYPPNHFGCRARVRTRSAADITKNGTSVSDSTGNITEEDRLVSKNTGELRPVAVYNDPTTGKKFSPDVGFSYNPGQKSFTPDLKKYDADIAKLYK